MKSLRAFILGAILSSLLPSLAVADNYYPDDGGLYWSVRGGLSQVRHTVSWDWSAVESDTTVTPPTPSINSHHEVRGLEMNYGAVVGGAIGYTFLYPDSPVDLRLEAEAIYRINKDGQVNSEWYPTSTDKDISLGHSVAPIDGSLEVRSAMANFFMDFHTPTRFTPYVGVGAGISQLVAQGWIYDANRAVYNYPYPQRFDETIYGLSLQAIVGVGYRLTPGTMITLELRTFRLATDRWSDLFWSEELAAVKFDDWSLGLRLTF